MEAPNLKSAPLERSKIILVKQEALQFAGVPLRAVALGVDLSIVIALLLAIDHKFEIGLFSSVVLTFVYFGLLTATIKGTLGKRLLDLEVTTHDGDPLPFGEAIAREAVKALSVCTLSLGFLAAAFDPEKRTLHDRVGNSRVLRTTGSGLRALVILSIMMAGGWKYQNQIGASLQPILNRIVQSTLAKSVATEDQLRFLMGLLGQTGPRRDFKSLEEQMIEEDLLADKDSGATPATPPKFAPTVMSPELSEEAAEDYLSEIEDSFYISNGPQETTVSTNPAHSPVARWAKLDASWNTVTLEDESIVKPKFRQPPKPEPGLIHTDGSASFVLRPPWLPLEEKASEVTGAAQITVPTAAIALEANCAKTKETRIKEERFEITHLRCEKNRTYFVFKGGTDLPIVQATDASGMALGLRQISSETAESGELIVRSVWTAPPKKLRIFAITEILSRKLEILASEAPRGGVSPTLEARPPISSKKATDNPFPPSSTMLAAELKAKTKFYLQRMTTGELRFVLDLPNLEILKLSEYRTDPLVPFSVLEKPLPAVNLTTQYFTSHPGAKFIVENAPIDWSLGAMHFKGRIKIRYPLQIKATLLTPAKPGTPELKTEFHRNTAIVLGEMTKKIPSRGRVLKLIQGYDRQGARIEMLPWVSPNTYEYAFWGELGSIRIPTVDSWEEVSIEFDLPIPN